MSNFKGKFDLYTSTRLRGFRFYKFELKCTKWFGSEMCDCMISFDHNPNPWYFRNQKFKAGHTYVFSFDTVEGLQWYNHDFFALLNKKGEIVQKWELKLKEYGPGECPDCHGTKKCKYCHGKGFVYPPTHPELYKMCEECGGTGTCHTCDIPVRQGVMGGAPTGIDFGKL